MSDGSGKRRIGKNHTLVTAGEFFLDLIFYDLDRLPKLGEELKTEHFAFSLGGGAAISASAACLLGRPTRLVTAWGDSPFDKDARARLRAFGVDSDWSRIESDTTCGLTMAVSTRTDRYFLTFPGANRSVESHLLSAETHNRLRRVGHVHFALTPRRWNPFRDLVTELQSAGVTCSWDLGWDPEAAGAPGFREVCHQLDVLFFNQMEALQYTGAARVAEALPRLSSADNTVVVKKGEQGAIATTGGSESVEAASIAVDALESTGAGDAFNGGFLNAWMDGAPLRDCLLAGNICGSLSTRSPGGVDSLPSQAEFLAFLNQLKSRL